MKKILLVDDDEEDIEALEEILGDDYEIVVAEVSHDAIRLAEEIDFDLLLIKELLVFFCLIVCKEKGLISKEFKSL